MANVFSVSATATNLQVTDLGAFDAGSAGFTGVAVVTVALLNLTDGTNVASTTFSQAGGEAKVAGSTYAFKSVAPVMLDAGDTYAIVAYGFNGVNPNYNSQGGASAITFDSLGGALTQVGFYWTGTGAIAYSGSTLPGNPGMTRFGAGSLVVSAVPESSTYTMLLAGLAAVGFMVKRRSA